jgi:hypothetical protein
MLKKIIIGILLVSVIGAGGAALAYNAATKETQAVLKDSEALVNADSAGIAVQEQKESGQNVLGAPVLLAEGAGGEPWEATGTIAAIDDYGIELALEEGESVYVELGPPDFWKSQGITLEAGETATVIGTANEGMIHAAQVVLADGQVLRVRSETGQPLWSGGVNNGQVRNAGQGDGDHVPDPQAQVDEWLTMEGTLMSFQGGGMTMSTPEGNLIAFQTGQPRFFSDQGITFQVWDAVSVLGFYEGDQFMAGEITQLSTGLRVMLRDPNGRPLWAGPGNSSGGGNGRGGNGQGAGGNS